MDFSEEKVRIPFEQKQLDGVFNVPAGDDAGRAAVVMTHGAGGDMHVTHLETLARALARSGVLCLRFTCKGLNLAYRIRAYRAAVDVLWVLVQRLQWVDSCVRSRRKKCRVCCVYHSHCIHQDKHTHTFREAKISVTFHTLLCCLFLALQITCVNRSFWKM